MMFRFPSDCSRVAKGLMGFPAPLALVQNPDNLLAWLRPDSVWITPTVQLGLGYNIYHSLI